MKLFVVAFALSCLVAFNNAETSGIDEAAAEPTAEYLPPVEEAVETKLADDGYRYRTVRRLKYRHRRDVSAEYLPPTDAPTQEYLPPVSETKLADDGYRYKTVRKLRFRARHRRDVAEIETPANDYLPPVEVELAPELNTVVGEDGYRYKTVRRLKYRRQRRDVDEAEEAVDSDAAPANEYLPPVVEKATDEPVAEVKSAELADDGYRYKTVRRLKYRYRH